MRLLVVLLLAVQVCVAEPEPLVAAGAISMPRPGLRITIWDALEPDRFLAEGITDERGGFAIVLGDGPFSRRTQRFGPVVVRVSGEGIAEARASFGLPELTGGEPPVIEVRAAIQITGTVLDAGGDPSPGALIRAFSRSVEELTTTDEQGRFVLRKFAGGKLGLVAQGAGTPPTRVLWDGESELRIDLPGAEVPVERPDVPPLVGRVLDEEAHPLPDVRVGVRGRIEGSWTDERGAFEVAVERAGMVELVAERHGFRPVAVRVEAGRRGRIELRLRKGESIAGKVEPPTAGVRVESGDAVAYTDRQGLFLLEGVSAGPRLVVASRKGARSMPVTSDGEAPIRLELRTALPIEVALHNDAGASLASVAVVCSDAKRRIGPRSVETDAKGLARFADLPVGLYRFAAAAQGHGEAKGACEAGDTLALVAPTRLGERRVVVEVLGAPGRVQVRLERRESPTVRRGESRPQVVFDQLPAGTYDLHVHAEGRIDVRQEVVVAADKDPAPIRIKPPEGGVLRFVARPGARVVVQTLKGEPAPLVVLELEEGEQTVRGFGPGRYRFISRAEGELIAIREADCGPQSPPRTIDLRAGKAATLELTVVDRVGDPVESARITLVAAGGFEWPVRRLTDAAGRVLLTRLPEGRVEVRAALGERLGATQIEVVAGAALRARVVVP